MKKINLLDPQFYQDQKRKGLFTLFYPIALLCVFFFIFLYNIISSDEGFFQYVARNFKNLNPNTERVQKTQEENERTNILLLGHGGQGHDGPNLTDSIQVISIHKSNNTATIISVPRDLLVDIPDYGFRKLNHAYALTEQSSPGSGGLIAGEVIEKVLGIKIDYYVTVNFAGFNKIIDDLGGIELNVPHGFIDYKYPDINYTYQTITFKKGWQTMTGDQALKFARSRHGICTTLCEEPEGSDFARAKRQQIILKAIKDQVLSSKTLRNPKNLYTLMNAYKDMITTNINLWNLKDFYDIAKDTDTSDIEHFIIDSSENGLLRVAIIEGAYVLTPKFGNTNYNQIHLAVQNLLYPKELSQITTDEQIFVEIQNGTTINGFGSHIANKLDKQGIKVTKVSNASSQNTTQTIIYDFTKGKKQDILQALHENLPGARISIDIPEEILATQQEIEIINVNNTPIPTERKTDFLVILGADLYATLGITL